MPPPPPRMYWQNKQHGQTATPAMINSAVTRRHTKDFVGQRRNQAQYAASQQQQQQQQLQQQQAAVCAHRRHHRPPYAEDSDV